MLGRIKNALDSMRIPYTEHAGLIQIPGLGAIMVADGKIWAAGQEIELEDLVLELYLAQRDPALRRALE